MSRSRGRRMLVPLAFALGGTAIALLGAEFLVRMRVGPPVHQIVRGNHLREVNGVVVWEAGTDRENRSCAEEHPERQRIVLFGNSISYGGQVKADQTFGALLQDRLNKARPNPGFCVMNFSQQAFRYKQRYAIASEEIPRYRPAIALLQDWYLEWGGQCYTKADYHKYGDAAFFLGAYSLRPDGFPGVPGVPDAPNRWFFLHSFLYQYLTVALLGDMPPPDPRDQCTEAKEVKIHTDALREFADLARQNGARPAAFFVPNLAYPLNERHTDEIAQEQPIVDYGRDHGFPVWVLRDDMRGVDNVAARVDNWHFSAAGHQAVAEALERHVLALLDSQPLAKPAPH